MFADATAPPSARRKQDDTARRIEINPALFAALKKLSDRQQKGLADIINLMNK
ncbi:MAG: hypothetical protein NC084_09945 [Bacteroides sp.]|nr:hypothetical protein [Bacteroides sp.]